MKKDSSAILLLVLAVLLSLAAAEAAHGQRPQRQTQEDGCGVENDKCGLKDFLDGAKTPEERQRRYDDFMKLLGVLDELAGYRNRLFADKDFIDLFPTAYYHTTFNEMERIRRGEYQYPVEKMGQMLAFYDAYKVNRQNWETGNVRGVEEHWRKHFDIVAEENRGPSAVWAVFPVLTSGIDAHVEYDLARAIKHAYQNRFDRSATPDKLKADFELTDRIFSQTVSRTNQDIAEAFSFTGFDKVAKGVGFDIGAYFVGDKKVINGRHQAWDDAFNSSSLKTKNTPQPVMDHSALFEAGQEFCPAQLDGQPTFDNAHVFGVKSYVNTGLVVGGGDRLFIRASGKVNFGPNVGAGGPEGVPFFFVGPVPVPVNPIFSLFSDTPHGGLIGRVRTAGAGERDGWLFIARGGQTTAQAPGVLELNVNDSVPDDNEGAFRVEVVICKAK